MKRVHFFLTMVFVGALLCLFAGCSKLEDQEPGTKNSGTVTNGVARTPDAMTLSDVKTMPAPDEKTVTASDGKTVPADWADARHSFVTRDGTVYEGEMKDGKPNGQGTATDARGTYQKGEWRNGAIYRVSGTCVFPDGTKEVGTWNNDGTTSGGTIWRSDGRIYKGEWLVVEGQNELPSGTGTMTWPDGRQYAGHFMNGKMDGVGKMTWPDGKIEDGTWAEDAFVGAAK
jgi:hypothetical protein